MKRLIVMAVAMILGVFVLYAGESSAQAGVPGQAIGAATQNLASDTSAVVKVGGWRGGGWRGGGWRGGGWRGGGWRGGGWRGYGWRGGWGGPWFWGPGPYCPLRCGPYGCWRACW